MNLNMDNQLNITGPNTTAVVEALNGGQHTTGDEVYFDPERIIPMPEGLDEVTLDEMGRSEQDMWRLRNWGAYRVYRNGQDITTTSGKAVIDFYTIVWASGFAHRCVEQQVPRPPVPSMVLPGEP